MYALTEAAEQGFDVKVTTAVEGLVTAWVEGRMVGQYTPNGAWVERRSDLTAVPYAGTRETWEATVFLVHIYGAGPLGKAL